MQFDNTAGQDRIKDYLTNSVKKDNLTHGYIFEGPSNIGKLEMAKTFAQLILCRNSNTKPCEKCGSCIKANTDNHPDIHILKLDESSIKRKNIDEIHQAVYMKPYESSKKIFIIDEAHKMTPQASNTFLKTLEEPPEDTIIILLTISRDLLLDTITSRCKVIEFDKISKKEIINKLKDKYGLSDQEAEITAGYSKGNLYKAFKIHEGEDKILEYREKVAEIIDGIFEKGKTEIYEHEKYFNDNKENIDEIVDVFMIWFRDVLFVKEDISDMIVNTDKLELLKKHSKGKNSIKISQLQDDFQETYDDFNRNVNYNLIIENMLSKIQEV
jgi:DNA polymerase-3 subunit delta'